MKNLMKFALALLVLLGLSTGAVNAADATSIPDPATVVTTASTTVFNVTTLIAGVIGFFVVTRIVKWIRK